jgi:hypothetical protein
MDLQALTKHLDQADTGVDDWRLDFLEMLRLGAEDPDCMIQLTMGANICHELANDIEFAMIHRRSPG